MSTIISEMIKRTASDEWRTPDYMYRLIVELMRNEFKTDLRWDLAASAKNAKCPNFYTIEDDSLQQDWNDKEGFLNPPYTDKGPGVWLKKCSESAGFYGCLIKAATDCKWWHQYAMKAELIYFVEGRVPFIPPDDYVPVKNKKTGRYQLTGNNHGSAILLYGPGAVHRGLAAPRIRTCSPNHVREFKLEDYLKNCPERQDLCRKCPEPADPGYELCSACERDYANA